MTRQELRVALEFYCGCGDPQAASATLTGLLESFDDGGDRRFVDKVAPDNGAAMLILYWLTDLDLIEHGGSVSCSWLTGKGARWLEALKRERADNFEALHGMACVHGYDVTDTSHDCK